jgi:histidinol-phosphate aminotransferase
MIRSDRDHMLKQLSLFDELEVYPSQANFILFKLKQGDATDVFNRLRDAGVLIKNMSPAGGVLSNCLRVTIGTSEENQAFMSALTKALSR